MLRVILFLAPLPFALAIVSGILSVLPTSWSQALQPYVQVIVVVAFLAQPLVSKKLRERPTNQASDPGPSASAPTLARPEATYEPLRHSEGPKGTSDTEGI